MKNRRYILAVLGALFFFLGLYYRVYDPGKSNSYEYLGIGTWVAGIIFYTLFQKYREITSLILGLLALHAGVLLLIKEHYSNPKLLGLLVFTIGIVIVLGSGFFDCMKRGKEKS
ncbi:MAG: hypothetical protein Q8O41_02910 [Candidatus Methanoperedens sp.]|nr:hypothetical protein [Candidatus Methanoperedens sp.]